MDPSVLANLTFRFDVDIPAQANVNVPEPYDSNTWKEPTPEGRFRSIEKANPS